jgi:hypothetical protein
MAKSFFEIAAPSLRERLAMTNENGFQLALE